jgi:hypothetical protein
MPKGYTFQVASATSPTPNAQDIEKEIARLGFNNKLNHTKVLETLRLRKLTSHEL